MRFDAVIFDLDGTLLDTESLARDAGRLAFAHQGLELSDALFLRLVGTAKDTGATILRECFAEIDLDALERDWVMESRRLSADGIRLKSGALDLVQHLADTAHPRAIATSSQRDGTEHKLGRTPLAPLFEVVVTRDCVTQAKPAPEPYELAAARLGVDPARCLAFEDSETGARAAHAAGMTVVQVPDMAPVSGQFAHHVADDLLTGARLAGLLA